MVSSLDQNSLIMQIFVICAPYVGPCCKHCEYHNNQIDEISTSMEALPSGGCRQVLHKKGEGSIISDNNSYLEENLQVLMD